jgi:hypothetical protein
VELEESEFTAGKAKCQDEFDAAQLLCESLTGKKKKKCKREAVDDGLVCYNALSCPPDGTKS